VRRHDPCSLFDNGRPACNHQRMSNAAKGDNHRPPSAPVHRRPNAPTQPARPPSPNRCTTASPHHTIPSHPFLLDLAQSPFPPIIAAITAANKATSLPFLLPLPSPALPTYSSSSLFGFPLCPSPPPPTNPPALFLLPHSLLRSVATASTLLNLRSFHRSHPGPIRSFLIRSRLSDSLLRPSRSLSYGPPAQSSDRSSLFLSTRLPAIASLCRSLPRDCFFVSRIGRDTAVFVVDIGEPRPISPAQSQTVHSAISGLLKDLWPGLRLLQSNQTDSQDQKK
jgi:hypothetical protein